MSINLNDHSDKFSEGDLRNLLKILFPKDQPSTRIIKSLSEKFYSGELNVKRVMEIMKNESWYNTLDKISRADWSDYEFSDELS